jgi:Ca2+-binding EF-hand superfamily protein
MAMKMTLQSQINMIMKAIFAKYDSDNNGYLDEDEVKSLLTDAFSGEDGDKDVNGKSMVDQFYKKVDVDGDGKISKD